MRTILVLLTAIFSQAAFAQQLPVRLEPHHHNVFENDRIRVLDVHIGPGDTTAYHLHATPSVFMLLTTTRSGSQRFGEDTTQGVNQAGSIDYDELEKPRYHRVWNSDTSWFHVLDIELPGASSGLTLPAIQGEGIRDLFNGSRANGFLLQPAAGAKIRIPASAPGYLLVSLGDADISISTADGNVHRIMKHGHYQWLTGKGQATLSFKDAAGLALIQLK